MGSPKSVDGWNVAHLNGGLLLSADDFMVQFNSLEVKKFIHVLNGTADGKLRDVNGDVIIVHPGSEQVILTRVNDKVYPDGIILPVQAFSDFEESVPVLESLHLAFRHTGAKIVHALRGEKAAKAKSEKHSDRLVRALRTAMLSGKPSQVRRLTKTENGKK